jgi:GNAT superfamily N-acetyltransferase
VTTFRIAPAHAGDAALILQLIKGLAEYERLSDEVVASEDDIRRWLFGPRPAAEVVIGYAGSTPAGFALFFHNFSTFRGRPGLYLEDLYVVPEWRGQGLGRQLIAHLARLAVERDCGRMEWAVLDWNEPAIGFYRKLGALMMDEWRLCRLSGDSLTRVAASR